MKREQVLKALLLLLSQEGNCNYIHCTDCFFELSGVACKEFCSLKQIVEFLKENLKEYTEEEIFEALL